MIRLCLHYDIRTWEDKRMLRDEEERLNERERENRVNRMKLYKMVSSTDKVDWRGMNNSCKDNEYNSEDVDFAWFVFRWIFSFS